MKKTLLILMTSLFALTSCSSSSSVEIGTGQSQIIIEDPATGSDNSNKKKADIILTYAATTNMSSAEKNLISEFNMADNGFKINVKTYEDNVKYIGDSEDGEMRIASQDSINARNIEIMNDIISGEIDIISDCSFGTDLFENLMGKGAFVDLYSFMEKDDEINSSTLNTHVLELHETDGKLYMMPYLFKIDTLCGKTEYVGTKENQTLDEFIANWESMPEGSMICGHDTKSYVYMNVLRNQMFSFVDYANAEVSFDSPEFIKLLEFCNTFYNDDGDYHERAWNAVNMVERAQISGFDSFHLYIRKDDVTFVGYPSEDGKGSYIDSTGYRLAINSAVSKERQKGAWEFLRMAAGEEYQLSIWNITDEKSLMQGEMGFPVNLNAYNEAAKRTMNGEYYPDVRSFSGVEENVGQITEDELKRCTDYINNVQAITTVIDRDILFDVIESEIYAYFDGAQSAETAAEMLQNRLSIYVSESQ